MSGVVRGGRGRRTPVVLVGVMAAVVGGLTVARETAAAGLGSPVRDAVLAPPPLPAGAVATTAPAAAQSMALDVVLPPADPGALDAELAALYQAGSPQYHHWLMPAQFSARFGPDPAAVQSVRAWLSGAGLHDDGLSGFAVKVSGTRRAVAAALGVSFEGYRLGDGRDVVTTSRAPLVPSGVLGDVGTILGLNDLAQVQEHDVVTPLAAPAPGARSRAALELPHVDGVTPCPQIAAAAAADGVDTPDQVGAAYQLGRLIAAGQSGAGQTVAVYEIAQHQAADVEAYEQCFGLDNPVSTVSVDGGGGTDRQGTAEADLDIEQLATQAPSAAIVSYEGPNSAQGAYDTWATIVAQDAASVISTSIGLCEADGELGGYLAEDTLFEEAAAQGQTVLAASGDSGSEDCFPDTQAPNKASTTLEVDYPAASRWVTGVGGTTLSTAGPETVWNDCQGTTSSLCATAAGSIGAGGGGVSRQETAPSWQAAPYQWSNKANACISPCRNVPDLSANAGTAESFEMEGNWYAVGGTSAAAPLVAGFVADVDSGCVSSRQGDVAAQLYALAAKHTYGTAFTDVTTGDNDFTGTYHGSQFPAARGYDPASGIGTPLVAGWSCPEVEGLSPSGAAAGTTVTVRGLGLEAASFSFGAARARVVSATATSAVVVVPAGAGATVGVSASDVMGTGTTTAAFAYPQPAPRSPPTAPVAQQQPPGYWEVASDGGIFAFGAPFDGSTGASAIPGRIVGMAADTATGGYWLVSSRGQVYGFDAPDEGSMGGVHLDQPIVGMAADPTTGGYWLVAADGGIFAFGGARFHGSTGGVRLDRPIVGMAADPATGGYWLVASDGGVFSFGAPFRGSTGGIRLDAPVVGMAADVLTGGYWLVASDGGVFSFGAPFSGSVGGVPLDAPVVGLAPDPLAGGYFEVASDGGIFAFGPPFEGSVGGTRLARPVVGMALASP